MPLREAATRTPRGFFDNDTPDAGSDLSPKIQDEGSLLTAPLMTALRVCGESEVQCCTPFEERAPATYPVGLWSI